MGVVTSRGFRRSTAFLVAAAVLVGCGGGGGHTITGSILSKECHGSVGNATVEIRNEADDLIGAGTTTASRVTDAGCRARFEINDVPDAKFYSFHIGTHGAPSYSKAEMERMRMGILPRGTVQYTHIGKQRTGTSPWCWTPIELRLWSRADCSDPARCWVWTGYRDKCGYGRIQSRGRLYSVHRKAYELAVGPIPDGFEIDHLCSNRACINPAHLEAVTHRANVLRGNAPAARQARQTHCIHGHEFTPENTRWYTNGRRRQCDACQIARNERRRAERLTVS